MCICIFNIQVRVGNSGTSVKWHARSPGYDLGFASTCHKLQGRTVRAVLLSLETPPGNNAFIRWTLAGLYVVMSRVRSGNDVGVIKPTDHCNIGALRNHILSLRPPLYLIRALNSYNNGIWEPQVPAGGLTEAADKMHAGLQSSYKNGTAKKAKMSAEESKKIKAAAQRTNTAVKKAVKANLPVKANIPVSVSIKHNSNATTSSTTQPFNLDEHWKLFANESILENTGWEEVPSWYKLQHRAQNPGFYNQHAPQCPGEKDHPQAYALLQNAAVEYEYPNRIATFWHSIISHVYLQLQHNNCCLWHAFNNVAGLDLMRLSMVRRAFPYLIGHFFSLRNLVSILRLLGIPHAQVSRFTTNGKVTVDTLGNCAPLLFNNAPAREWLTLNNVHWFTRYNNENSEDFPQQTPQSLSGIILQRAGHFTALKFDTAHQCWFLLDSQVDEYPFALSYRQFREELFSTIRDGNSKLAEVILIGDFDRSNAAQILIDTYMVPHRVGLMQQFIFQDCNMATALLRKENREQAIIQRPLGPDFMLYKNALEHLVNVRSRLNRGYAFSRAVGEPVFREIQNQMFCLWHSFNALAGLALVSRDMLITSFSYQPPTRGYAFAHLKIKL